MASSYVLFRRTADGRLRHGLRVPCWLPWAFLALAAAGAAHLLLRLPEIGQLHLLRMNVQAARQERAQERAALLALNERLSRLRQDVEPVAGLNGKLASVTGLAGAEAQQRPMGSAGIVEGGVGTERRLARQLAAQARALVEEVAFQEGRQRQLASILRERALEFAARPSIWPVRGTINSDFGYRYMARSREYHKGVDIGVPYGSQIVAPADGKVVSVGYESGYGLMVVIEHRHGLSTVYAHLKSAEVEEGDEVKRGTPIAHSGMSGRTTGSHLHYEVRQAGNQLDPMNFMLN
ncbi:M23 family metallopeptidase [Fundidesulfovibrio soli]|uniref:M23 family metallopeptidase n=1 Tax=Fundidesulfovibrio soli TaxID=2922716 RepID=UPI001FAECA7B